MNHNVFRDLAPTYIDNLTSEETNKLIEEHLKDCKECREYLDQMKEDVLLGSKDEKEEEKRNIDYFKKVRSKQRKKVFTIVGSLLSVFLIILISFYILISHQLKPLPEAKRNISTTNIKMVVDMEDVANRTPIVRTYTKKEFDNFNENKIKKIREIVNGNIEGDIPALVIENGRGILNFTFEKKDEKGVFTKIIPDDIPKIKISVSSYSSEKGAKEIDDSFMEHENREGIYLYEIKRYFNEFTEDENFFYEDDEFFMEFLNIEINYEIDKEKYVSIFSIHSVEDK
ncbi:MAG: zf-HC2 domain-containing protein [Tissierella sp.]|uniref:zf-HC2 domain-containing protein n=1 Tax=Tissierella sp. TaxID=41274 RepID=UPI003F97A360